ncbi:hypothetical protein C0993_011599, partial [Termitomyces sp. T159_Od127]
TSPFLNQGGSPPAQPKPAAFEATPEEASGDNDAEEVQLQRAANANSSADANAGATTTATTGASTSTGTSTGTSNDHKRNSSMNHNFKFPTPTSSPVVQFVPNPAVASQRRSPPEQLDHPDTAATPVQPATVVTPSSIEVPPPPLVEKEKTASSVSLEEGEDDVGDTVDIPLN